MTYTVEVDTDLCMSSRECVRVAPDAFEIDEEEMVSRPTPAAATTGPALLRKAVSACPVNAIAARPD